jgi:para-nitrobenzyl esterase
MNFGDAPHAADHVFPGMYALHEESVCRRRANGDMPWNWRVGLASPKLPGATPSCHAGS